MERILILGVNSYVGYYLAKKLAKNFKVWGSCRQENFRIPGVQLINFEIRQIQNLRTFLLESKIDRVINCISIGNVDQCEQDKELAKKVNFELVKDLCDLTNELNIQLTHFSSNAVYAGQHPPHSENSPKDSPNYYGISKKMADDYIEAHHSNFLIARIMTLYGFKEDFHRNNPATMIIQRLKDNLPLKLVNDVYNNLLYIEDLVEIIKLLIEKKENGIFNISGDDKINRYELGKKIGFFMKKSGNLISECTSDAFPALAKRAPDTSFDNTKIKTILDFKFTPLDRGLTQTIERSLDEN